jgi:hypothetical protein
LIPTTVDISFPKLCTADNNKEIAMQFSYSNHGNGSKATKFALVAGLHVAVGASASSTA